MPTEQEFLQAISDDPDNDLPRLVYADWLDEQGDPRGEFIRVQCELANGNLHVGRRYSLTQRENDLLCEHRNEWLAKAPFDDRPMLVWQFQRGFVESATLDHDDFDRLTLPLTHCFPTFREVSFYGLELAHLERIANSHLLAGITHLDLPFSGRRVRENDIPSVRLMRNVFRSPHLEKVTSLRISAPPHPTSMLASFLEKPQPIREFSVEGCSLSSDWFSVFIGLKGISHLEKLHFDCVFTIKDVYLLSVSNHLGRLRELSISQLKHGSDRSLETLKCLHALPQLCRLELKNCGVGPLALDSLLSAFRGRLERLNLDGNSIGDRGLSRLVDQEFPIKLRALEVGRNRIKCEGIASIADSPNLAAFQVLDLPWNLIGNKGLKALARSNFLTGLEELNLGHNASITDVGGVRLADGNFSNLKVLDLSGTRIGDRTAFEIAKNGPPNLEALLLGRTAVTNAGAKALLESERLSRLQFVDFERCLVSGQFLNEVNANLPRRVLTRL